MAGNPRFGVLLLEGDAGHLREMAQRAEVAGFHAAWTVEYYNNNSLVRLALMAAATKHMVVGTAVTAAFARAPLMIATAVSDIASIAPHRVVLGLGTSTFRMNRDWYGVDAEHPAPRLEELVRLLRELWRHSSGAFEFNGRFTCLNFTHLEKTALDPLVPIYTAGVNERMVRASGAVADGFFGHPIATTDYIRSVALPAIDAGRAKAGRSNDPFHISTQVITSIDDDEDAARRRAALQVAFYATTKTYDIILAVHGFEEEADAIRAAFAARDRDGMLRAISDRMLREMAVYGSPSQVVDQLERYQDVTDSVILYSPQFGISSEEGRRCQYEIVSLLEPRPRG